MRIADLGYFNLSVFAQQSKDGGFWLSRLKLSTAMLNRSGDLLDMMSRLDTKSQSIDVEILLGKKAQVKARLLAQRVPNEVANQRRRQIRKTDKRKGKTPSKRRPQLRRLDPFSDQCLCGDVEFV